ncbi:MAG: prefoldin subunit beta, partial [Methanobacteriota archaeon]
MGGRGRPGGAGSETVKDISPQLQNQIAQYQQLQNQLQVLGTQRVQLEAKLREIEGTLEELGKISGETPIYKSIGMLLVRQDDREALKKELEEH